MHRWIILALFVVSQLILSVGFFAWGPLAPFLRESLSLTVAQIGYLGFVLNLASAISVFPSGISVDRYGVRKNFLLWIGITGASLLLIGLISKNYLLLLILVGICGIGYGMGNPVAIKGLFAWFSPQTRATAMGIRQAAVPAGGAIAGIFFVYMALRYPWSMAVGIVGAIAILTLIIAFFTFQEAPTLSSTAKREKKSKLGLKELLSDIRLIITFIIMALFGIGQGIIATFLVLYLKESLGYSTELSGLMFTFVMIGGGVGRILWGLISDRVFKARRAPVLLIMAVLATIVILVTLSWSADRPQWLFSIPAIFLGFLGLGYNAVALVFVAELGDPSRAGTAVGLGSLMAWGGLSLGIVAFGNMVTSFQSYFYAWLFVAAAYFVAILLCASLILIMRRRPSLEVAT